MTGTVKWFNTKDGFEFITGDDGKDAFAHHENIQGKGFKVLNEGQRVEYDTRDHRKGLRAENIHVLEEAPAP